MKIFGRSNPTPQEKYETTVYWFEHVIPTVDAFIQDLDKKIFEKTNHKLTEEEKKVLFENYLGLATEVFNSA